MQRERSRPPTPYCCYCRVLSFGNRRGRGGTGCRHGALLLVACTPRWLVVALPLLAVLPQAGRDVLYVCMGT